MIELRLLGEPAIFVDGQVMDLRPRAILELASVIITRGVEGISRADVSERLWGHLDHSNARQQLRIAVHKLRESSLGEYFDLQGKTLRVMVETDVDIQDLARISRYSLSEIESVIIPVAVGWNQEHWQAESDAVGETLAKAISEFQCTSAEQQRLTDLLFAATSVYPTTIRLQAMLVRMLEEQSRLCELNEVVIAFETQWVERFGPSDIPNVVSLSRDFAHNSMSRTEPRVIPAVWATGSLVIIVVCVSLIAAVVRGSGDSVIWPLVREKSSSIVISSGQKFFVRQLQLTNAKSTEIVAFKTLRDGGFAFLTDDQSSKRWIEMSPGQNSSKGLLKFELFDRTDKEEIYLQPSAGDWIQVLSQNSKFTIGGTAVLPKVFPTVLFSDGTLLFARMCKDPGGCHTKLFLWKSGIERELRGPISAARITVPTAVIDNTIYAKTSAGLAEKWHYHAFSYDLRKGLTSRLNCSPVIGELKNGSLITRPESTIIDHGDYQTRPDGKVAIEYPGSWSMQLSVEGQTTFPKANMLGNLALLVLAETNPYSSIVFVDSRSRKINPFPFLGDRVSKILPDPYGRPAILFRKYDVNGPSNDYTLI